MDVFIFGIEITVVGLTVVFIALALLAWILSYFDRIDNWVTNHRSKSQDAMVESAAEKPVDEGISPEIIAAISAAVAVAIGSKVKIKHVRYRRQTANPTWQTQGRATIMASHTINRPKNQ
jgi:sodium pump decarboxylase gamma subunit